MDRVRTNGRGRYRLGAIVGGITLAATLAACGSSTSSSNTNTPASGTPQKGGTAIFAEAASAVPNFIFPFMPINFFSVTNIPQFQQLMFRPLYWFGNGPEPTLNSGVSLASLPVYGNKTNTVQVSLKPHWVWSNGEQIKAQDIVFWMNMMKTDKAGWAAYAPGTIPDNVKNVVATSPTSVTFTLTGAVNNNWFTYNELSQITPMPIAWDVTAAGAKAGSGGCSSATYDSISVDAKGNPVSASAKACHAVYTFLSGQAGYNPANPKAANNSLATYATNPLWQVVDGPWHLSSFSASGNVTMIPNKKYSGSFKPVLDKFEEVPFTSDTAEFNALIGGKLTYGYIPVNDLPEATSDPTKPGKNNSRVADKFNLAPIYSWSINYFPYNFNSVGNNGQAGKIFSKLYFRQAFQQLVDQPLYGKQIFKGYAVPTYGPVPVQPENPFSSKEEQDNPYPYSVDKATNLLKNNGWKVVPNGTSTCQNAAKCGVPAGTPLAFTMQYASGNAFQTQEVQAEQAAWAQVGIKITLQPAAFDTVIGNAVPCKGASCTWELANWGGGWLYAPDYYPTGEEIFQTGAGSNVGSYSDAKNDALIKQTTVSNTPLTEWENYLTEQLPFVWQPNEAYALYEVAKNLGGALPVSPLLGLNPEQWYFTK